MEGHFFPSVSKYRSIKLFTAQKPHILFVSPGIQILFPYLLVISGPFLTFFHVFKFHSRISQLFLPFCNGVFLNLPQCFYLCVSVSFKQDNPILDMAIHYHHQELALLSEFYSSVITFSMRGKGSLVFPLVSTLVFPMVFPTNVTETQAIRSKTSFYTEKEKSCS